MTVRPLLVCALLILFLTTVTQAGQPSGETVSLFNGENLHGWHVTGCQVAVEDGALVLKGGDGFVRTDHRYGDFILELDWKALGKESWDSGIYIRSELPSGERPWPKRYQVNLLKGKEGNLIGFKDAESTGLTQTGRLESLQAHRHRRNRCAGDQRFARLGR